MNQRTLHILLWLPLGGFMLVLALVGLGLIRPHDVTVRSQMVGKPLPAFALRGTRPGGAPLASRDFADGRVRLLNIFASWCVPCAAEVPQLMQLRQAGVTIEGIASRDRRADSLAFLRANGDPYDRIGDDADSAVQIAIGSSGVPETYVIDGRGVIRLQHVGPLEAGDVGDILAAVKDAR